MLSINRNLIALAMGAALAAPLAFAGDKTPAPAKAARATDAVSQKATARESSRMVTETPMSNVDGASPKSPPGKGNWWAEADIDGDGKLSAAEAKANAGVETRFVGIDADGDGYLTNAEYRKFYTSEASQGELHAQAHSAVVTRDVWTKLDANSDGKLSSSEVTSNTEVNGAFSSMDGNGDGFVTQAEYTAYAKKHM